MLFGWFYILSCLCYQQDRGHKDAYVFTLAFDSLYYVNSLLSVGISWKNNVDYALPFIFQLAQFSTDHDKKWICSLILDGQAGLSLQK